MALRFFELKKGVPVPGAAERMRIDALLRTANVGDSFVVPMDTIAHVRSLIDEIGSETGNRYLGAGVDGGFCVWRLK